VKGEGLRRSLNRRNISKRRQVLFAGGALLLLPQLARAACVATQRDALGPFYVKDAPAQSDLCSAAGENGRLAVSGRILGAPDCKPLAGAVVEVWQADAKGEYSQVSRGRKDDPRCLLRATLTAGADGRYAFRSVLAGEYPGRPSHIHYRVSMHGYRTLVTQLYFNSERGVDAARVAALTRAPAVDGKQSDYQAAFDIVLARDSY
jgi:protocatechuate 3,4-dioxygenase beta subunit